MERVECRGCLLSGPSADMHIIDRNLFRECTDIEVENDDLQHLCYHCHQQCQFWQSFKLLCQKKDQIRKLQIRGAGELNVKQCDLASQVEMEDGTEFQERIEAIDETKEENQIDFDSIPSSGDEVEKEEKCDSIVLGLDNENKKLSVQLEELEPAPDRFEGGIWRCPVCLACFTAFVYLREHIKECHFAKEDPRCTICKASFSSFPKVITHILSAHSTFWETYEAAGASTNPTHNSPDNRQECVLCGEILADGFLLYHHIKRHHFAEKDPSCPLCSKRFTTVRGTIYHVIIKHNVSEAETILEVESQDIRLREKEVPSGPAIRAFNISRFVECHLCESFHCNFEEYQTHFATDHTSEETNGSNITMSLAGLWSNCDGRSTPRPSSSSREAAPSPVPAKRNPKRKKQCHICGKFLQSMNMHLHRKLTNSCKFCGKKFCGIREMKRHVLEQHAASSSKHIFLKYSYK